MIGWRENENNKLIIRAIKEKEGSIKGILY